MRGTFRAIVVVNALGFLFLAAWFFLYPAARVVRDVSDPALSSGEVPRAAWRLFRDLTPRYERWARGWMTSGRGAHRPVTDISGTEWPVFGSAFYLWSVESLQEAWEKDPSLFAVAPKEYARGAVEAAKDLILDPSSAGWVRAYWGDDYLTREDCFYRMLIIGSLTTHHKLTGETRHLGMLREQVESLSAEIDRSPTGLIDDYPGQCYNTDVVAAIAMIRRADAALGTDHSEFARRALRGFTGECAGALDLVPFQADAHTGETLVVPRGSSNSYLCIFAPELWPEAAAAWYGIYERHYWQHRWMSEGFREFPAERPGGEWWLDVDAGPVLAGHGISACAFGLAAARVNGRFDHARPLAAEAIAVSWPLPDGTLAMPRMLSNATDAPLVGEAGVLFALTRRPIAECGAAAPGGGEAEGLTRGRVSHTTRERPSGVIPPIVGIVVMLYALAGLYAILLGVRALRKLRRLRLGPPRGAAFQLVLWLILAATGLALALAWCLPAGMFVLLVPLGMPFALPRLPKALAGEKR